MAAAVGGHGRPAELEADDECPVARRSRLPGAGMPIRLRWCGTGSAGSPGRVSQVPSILRVLFGLKYSRSAGFDNRQVNDDLVLAKLDVEALNAPS